MKHYGKREVIEIGRRIVTHDTILGTHRKIFRLTKGDEIEVISLDQYGNANVNIKSEEDLVSCSMLDRLSNKA